MAEESMRAPQALREEEAFLALAETLSALIALIQGDKLIYVNPAGAAILGYPQDYYKGRNFWDFALPEDRATIIERGRTRQQGVDHPRRFTERLRHADGHILWVDYSVDVIQLNGRTTTLVTGHDITDRKAEEAVRMSEALFRQLFTQSPVMICSVDKQDRLWRASDTWLKKLGYTQDEVIGTNGYQYLTPESIQRLGSALQEKIQKKEWLVKDVPLKTIRKDGTLMDILVTSVAKLDDKGEHDGWITVAQDISEINEAQKALFRSEERFRAAFQNAVIGKAVTGADLKFIQVNRAFCQMLGYSEAEFLGKTPRDFTHPGDIEQSKKFVAGILSGEKESCRQTKRYLHKDGRTVWVDMTATLVRDAEGMPSYFVTEIQDITERKRAEELLQISEDRFRAAFENAAIGKAITGLDIRLQKVNRAFCDMVGYTEAELLAISPVDLTHPDDRAATKELAMKVFSGEQPSGRQIKRYLHKKGHDVWVDMTTTLVRDAGGKPAYFVTEVIDITERKKAEELLKDSEAKLAEAQKLAHVGHWYFDAATAVTTWSAEIYRMLGVDPADPARPMERSLEMYHPDDRDRIARLVQATLEEGRSVDDESRIRDARGNLLWIHSIWNPRRDASGKIIGIYGVTQDITERKRAERLLRDHEAKLEEAQRIAHLGSWEHDIATNQSRASAELYRIAGLDASTTHHTMEQFLSCVHPDDAGRVTGLVRQAMAEGVPYEYEARFIFAKDRVRWLHAIGRVDKDPSTGKPARLYGVAQDITERKRSEELLKASEAKLAESQRIAKIGRWEWDVDTDRVTWSEEMYRIFGIKPEEFAGNYEAVFSRIHEVDRKRIASQVDNSVKSGEPHEQYYRAVWPNGEIRHVWATNQSVEDASGRVIRMFGVARDITERMKAEAEILDREAKLEEAQHIAHIGSWEIDLATRKVAMSDELHRIYAVDPATFVSSFENIVARIHPEDRERAIGAFEAAAAAGQSFEVEHRVVRDDGGVRKLWVRGRIGTDAVGNPVKMYGVAQDITEREKAENLLKDREASLAEAQKIAHVGSWDWDVLNGRVTWSDELFRILGLNPAVSTASFDGYVMRVHPDDRTAMTAQIQQGLADGLPFESEHRICRDSGQVRVVWTSCRMERDAAGKIVRMYGTAQDVTERKQAEDALRTSESRFRSLYTQAPVMMIAFGPDGRIREVSNYWLKVMAYERQEVIGQDGSRFITAESQGRLNEAMEKAVRAGERVLRSFPIVAVRKDGRTLDVLCTSVLEIDERGQSLGAIAVGVDVSEIRRAEEAVRESEARYRALVEHAPEAIVVLDVETGKFIDGNGHAEVMFGYSREKLLTMGPLDFCPRLQPGGVSSHDLAWDQIGRVMRGENPVFEFIHTHATGRDIPCQVRLSRLPATGQNLVRASLMDISELKALEEQVRHGEKMAAIGLLAAGVAHEIGNPLLALSMAAQSLERKIPDEYAQKKLGLIREHIDRISKIVRQMSDLARPQSAQRSSCDVNRVVERTLEVIRYDKRSKEVPIRFEPCPDVPFVQAVEDQLTQVCLNLALNALDAMAANPPARPKTLSIRVRCLKKDGRSVVRASFADTGPGIPEASRSKIFQPFYTTKATGKGTGLGLSVSYRIIQEHQGTLAFECGAKDGTEFFFELPV